MKRCNECSKQYSQMNKNPEGGCTPPVVQINNDPGCVLFHKVVFPASIGDDTTNPPSEFIGKYKNVLLVYEANNRSYMFSSDGMYTQLNNGVTDYEEATNLPQINSNTLIGDKTGAELGLQDKLTAGSNIQIDSDNVISATDTTYGPATDESIGLVKPGDGLSVQADGTLDIADIEEYAHFFDTVAEMQAAENLVNGSYARTLGYHSKNDGGNSLYKIRTITNDDVIDEASIIEMGDGSDQLIAELIYTDEISLEQFGCYGDNSNNDTTNFQKAVTFAETKKVKLISRGDKIYKVTSPINVDTLICNLNNATVTTPDNINIFYINSNNYYGQIENVTFDCTNASSAIYINNGRKKNIENVTINNVTTYGIYYNSGYEVLIDKCHINGKSNATNGIGIYMKSSDSKVCNTVLIDCHTAIKNEGMNFYEYVHAWIKTSALCANSVMFDIVTNNVIIDQCYSDTYYKTISLSSGGVAIIDQMRVFFNQSIYSSEESKPYFIYLNGITEAKRSSVTNSSINGAYSNKHIDFCNYVGVVKVNNNNLVWVDNYNGGLSYTPTTSSSAVTEVKTNNCIVKNGTMNIDILVVLDTSIGGSFEFSSIPADWRPITAINSSCSYGDSQWVQSGLGYLYINDKITGQVPTTGGGTKYVKIHLSYPIKNENS